MQTIPIDQIIIKDRQRRDFSESALEELAQSISAKGLMHPIVLRADKRTLVAGERRIRACESLGLTEIPFTLMTSLSEDDYYEAELEENVIRADLSMAERTAAIAQLHALRVKQNPSHTMKATAAEVSGRVNGHQIQKVSDALVIAEHLDNPAVAAAKTEKEALKIIYKEAAAEIAAALADTAPASRHIIEHGDAFNLIEAVKDETIDVLITDPPYGIGADTFGDQADGTHEYDDSAEYAISAYEMLARESMRVCKPRAHAYVFCDWGLYGLISARFEAAGWYTWPTPLIWFKGNQGLLPRPMHGPRRSYETILYAIKGDRPVIKSGALDVINYPMTGTRLHAAAKPPALFKDLLARSAHPGDLVLDPFCGSGPVFDAADELNLQAIGFELNRRIYEDTLARMLG